MRLILAVVLALIPLALFAHDTKSLRYAVIDGDVVLESVGRGVDETTPFAIASIGKTFTAVAVLRLVDRGVLALDAPASDHLPQNLQDDYDLAGVTLRHLLTMTSGLPDYYTGEYLDDALDDRDRVQAPRVALTYGAGESLFRPGTAFDYSNTNYVMLGLVLEAATGKSYDTVLQDEVFGPADMTDSFVFGTRPLPNAFATGHSGRWHVRDYYTGQGFGDGGVIASARDLVRFYQALFRGSALLPPDMRRAMVQDPVGAGYGMGIEVSDGLLGHSGGDYGFSSDVRMDPDTGNVAVELVAREGRDIDWTYDILLDP